MAIRTAILFVLLLATTSGCNNVDSTPGPVEATEIFVRDWVTQQVNSWADGLVAAEIMSDKVRDSIEIEIPSLDTTIVSETEHEAVIEVSYHADVYLGGQTIYDPDNKNVHVNVEPQNIVMEALLTVELVKVGDDWIVDNAFDGHATQKLGTEFLYIQTAIDFMMRMAGVTELDSAYTGIDTEEEAKSVTSGSGSYSLNQYYTPYRYPYARPYDITRDGVVIPAVSE